MTKENLYESTAYQKQTCIPFAETKGKTSICPYSLRANKEAGVATPLDWTELDRLSSGSHYGLKNIFRRLGAKNNSLGD